MRQYAPSSAQKPYDIHARLLVFACDVVRAVQFLHSHGPIGRALSYQILNSGTSIGANAAEGDGASSTADFVAKFRIALKEAKETAFRLRVCRGSDLLDERFDPLIEEADALIRILATIVSKASAGAATERHRRRSNRRSATG